MAFSSQWLSRWIYNFAAGLYITAVTLRTWLFYQGNPALWDALGLLGVWLVLFLSEPLISRRWRGYFPIYLTLQTGLVFWLLVFPNSPDFMAALLPVLSMQAMLNLPGRLGAAWIALGGAAMVALLWPDNEFESIALALLYTVGNFFVGSYTRTIRLAQAAREHNQRLAEELEQANRSLKETSVRLERLSAARERNRLARELHDSVTQTAFSMNLTAQSASLLLARDPSRVGEMLERLYTLSRSALAEMQVLINELKPEPQPDLPEALRRLVAESRFCESLAVDLVVEGSGVLAPAEQQGLARIAEEALNNILKHAQTRHAVIRVHLDDTPCLEIEDAGPGFDLQQARRSGGFGLASMHERAAEIGWRLQIESRPGRGTQVRVDKAWQEKARQKEGSHGNS